MTTKVALTIAAAVLLATGALWPVRRTSAAGASDIPPGDYLQTISVGGTLRRYILHVPLAYDGQKKLPLVLVLHGFSGTAASMIGTTRFSEKAEAEGLFVAYLQGMTVGPASPFYTCGCPSDPAAWNTGTNPEFDLTADDVAFVRELVLQLEANLRVDDRRVYAAGFSSGAGMSYRLGAELPNLLAGIAVVSGAIGLRPEANEPDGPFLYIPDATGSIPVIIFHGIADTHVLYYGGKATEGSDLLDAKPVADAVNYWTEANRCQGKSLTVTSAAGNVITTSYDGCFANSDVVLNTIVNGEHAWPNETLNGISATDAAWEFFSKHSLTAPQ
jgi:polyhydroxybutyrate depolymerase